MQKWCLGITTVQTLKNTSEYLQNRMRMGE